MSSDTCCRALVHADDSDALEAIVMSRRGLDGGLVDVGGNMAAVEAESLGP